MFRLSADTLTKITRKLPHAGIIRIKNLKIILFFTSYACLSGGTLMHFLSWCLFLLAAFLPSLFLSFFSHATKSNSLIFVNGQAFFCMCDCSSHAEKFS